MKRLKFVRGDIRTEEIDITAELHASSGRTLIIQNLIS